MRKIVGLLSLVMLLAAVSFAAPDAVSKVQPFPETLKNARYVYVTSYDGGQFNPNLLPEDREAIANVQNAIQKWGHYIVVYRPADADIILAVQSRGSEDVLAVYDARLSRSEYLWRVMGRDGLQKGETPLVTQLEQAVERISK